MYTGNIKFVWLCQTSGFQWQALRGALSNFSFCAVPGLGSLHIYSGALQPMPPHKPLMLFVPLFLHLISGIIQANAPWRFYHRTIIPWFTQMQNANPRNPGCIKTAAHKDFTIFTVQSARRFAYIVMLCVCDSEFLFTGYLNLKLS